MFLIMNQLHEQRIFLSVSNVYLPKKLLDRQEKTFTTRLWRILATAHHDFHRVLFHEYVHEDDKPAFHAELKSELERVHAFVDANKHISLKMEKRERDF